jgi:hypothetical protein
MPRDRCAEHIFFALDTDTARSEPHSVSNPRPVIAIPRSTCRSSAPFDRKALLESADVSNGGQALGGVWRGLFAVRLQRICAAAERAWVSKASVARTQAATTLIRAVFRERGFRRITISTSWSSAVNRFIKRSTEKPASL